MIWLRAARRRYRASPWRRLVEFAILGLSLALMAHALILNLSQIDFAGLRFDISYLLAALFAAWVALWIGAFAWAEIVRALCPDVPYLQLLKYHLLSTITKYLPGLGWMQVSKAIQLHRSGVPLRRTTVALFLEVGLVILTGLALAAQIVSSMPERILGVTFYHPLLRFGIPILLWGVCVTVPFVLFRFVLRRTFTPTERRRLALHLWSAQLLQLVGWLVLGAAFWLMGNTIFDLSLNLIPYCVVAIVISFVVSLIVIIVPNGLGIRELTMSTLFQVIMPVAVAVTVALMSRAVLVVAELLGALPVVFASAIRRNP